MQAVGSQIIQNIDAKLERSGATVLLTGLPIELQAPERLIRHFSHIGRVSAATHRESRALVTFADHTAAAQAAIDSSLSSAGITVQLINLSEAGSSRSGAVVQDMALDHQEKLTNSTAALVKVNTCDILLSRTTVNQHGIAHGVIPCWRCCTCASLPDSVVKFQQHETTAAREPSQPARTMGNTNGYENFRTACAWSRFQKAAQSCCTGALNYGGVRRRSGRSAPLG